MPRAVSVQGFRNTQSRMNQSQICSDEATAFQIGEKTIQARATVRKFSSNSNVVTALPKRLEQNKLRNMVMRIVKGNNDAMGTRKNSNSAMTGEDVSAFKHYDAIQ